MSNGMQASHIENITRTYMMGDQANIIASVYIRIVEARHEQGRVAVDLRDINTLCDKQATG